MHRPVAHGLTQRETINDKAHGETSTMTRNYSTVHTTLMEEKWRSSRRHKTTLQRTHAPSAVPTPNYENTVIVAVNLKRP